MSNHLVEEYRTLRLDRQALTTQANALEKREKEVKAEIIKKLLAGETLDSTVTLVTKTKPTVTDWPKFYAYIAKHGAFELLQRRVTESAWLERFAEGDIPDGTGGFPVHDIKV